MSLFDVIKYPITDILDYDQVRNLPDDILYPWLTMVSRDTEFTLDDFQLLRTGVLSRLAWPTIIRACIVIQTRVECGQQVSSDQIDNRQKLYTEFLKQLISIYEPV